MRVSKYLKVDKNVLLEYIYDDGNLIGEAYNIGINIKKRIQNYIAVNTSSTTNTQNNTLFLIDSVANLYGKFDTTNYNFLQLKEYASGFPIRHDIIKIYFPINYTFGEYLGIYLRVYGFDYNNKNVYDLTNFFYDISNIDQNENNSILDFVNPPLYFQERLWGKSITLDIPSLFALSNQRGTQSLKSNNINNNLTQGIGFNQQSPIFIDFRFLQSKSTINNITQYTLTPRVTLTLPQSPEFESIGLVIEESVNGDFFEVFATYNGNIGEFNNFINRSVSLGNRYYVQYDVTVWEQNIRGKSQRIIVQDNFLNKIEYRPIIKTSTTTAIIDVEMNLIDAVNDSRIVRKASFGMMQDMVSKYSLRLMKINLADASKPKIYNLKQTLSTPKASRSDMPSQSMNPNSAQIEVVKVPYPILIDRFNVVAKSESAVSSGQSFWGMGKMMLQVYPFDNVFKFVIATEVLNGQVQYMDLSNLGEIKLSFKNQNITVDCLIFSESGDNNLSTGFVTFKLTAGKIPDLRKIYDTGINVFYITATQQSTTTVIYTGLFKIYDSQQNVTMLQEETADTGVLVPESPVATTSSIPLGEAIATRRTVEFVSTEISDGQTSTTLVSTIDERIANSDIPTDEELAGASSGNETVVTSNGNIVQDVISPTTNTGGFGGGPVAGIRYTGSGGVGNEAEQRYIEINNPNQQ